MSEWIVCRKDKIVNAENIGNTEYCFLYDRGNKFLNDKIVLNTEYYFIILDGVIFNKAELMEQFHEKNWESLVLTLFQKYGMQGIDKLRGSFNGIIIEKKEEKITAFVDQLGERPIFYYNGEDEVIIASNFNKIIDILKREKIQYTPDKEAIKQLLYFGYMVDNRTCIEQIRRIFPGDYLQGENSKLEEKVYFRFENHNTIDLSSDELIERIDEIFVKALKQELDKDIEYGYKSLMDISGGMDARTVCFAAKKLGYENITNICYSQMNAYERNIAEDMIRYLGNDYLFKSLDNVSFLYSIDEIVKENYGLSYFIGITGGRDFLKVLNPNEFGIEHTGILGDVYEGSFNSKPIYEKPYINPKYRFSQLLDIDLDMSFMERYDDNELFKFYTRGVLAGTSTHLIRQNYFETYSPFENIDFLKLMFSIPLEQRIDGRIYMKWVNKKYPEAMKFTYSGTMCKPNSGVIVRKLRTLWNIILAKFIIPLHKTIAFDSEWNYKGTMNPMEYWYEKDNHVREFVELYYQKTIDFVKNQEIKCHLENIYREGNAKDKMNMLTVLSIYKQYIY